MASNTALIFVSSRQDQDSFEQLEGYKCKICELEYRAFHMRTVGCEHTCCKDCMMKLIKFQIDQYQPVRCFSEGCSHIMDRSADSVYHTLGSDMQRELDHILDNYDRMMNIRQCTLCKEGSLIEKIQADQKLALACNNCNKISCYNCFNGLHQGRCSELPRARVPQGCCQCRKCGSLIHKNKGCSHIKCLCGYEFCFQCGYHWNSAHICQFRQIKRHGISNILCNILKIILAFPILISFIMFYCCFFFMVSFLNGFLFGILGWFKALKCIQIDNKENNCLNCIKIIIWMLLLPLAYCFLFIFGLFIPLINLCWKEQLVFQPDLLVDFLRSMGSCWEVFWLI